MDNLLFYKAMIFPADGRHPHLTTLSASPEMKTDGLTGQLTHVSILPHPEVLMDRGPNDKGGREGWQWQVKINF